jgi:hypothetical protein
VVPLVGTEVHSVRETLLAGLKKTAVESASTASTPLRWRKMSQWYGAGEILTRHSFRRHGQRVTSSQSHSASWIATVLTSERMKMFGHVARFFIKLRVPTAVLIGRRGNCLCPAASRYREELIEEAQGEDVEASGDDLLT